MDSQEAYEVQLRELNAALEESLARHRQAAARGNLDDMEIEQERQKNLIGARHQLEALRDLWPGLVGKPKSAGLPVTASHPPTTERARLHLEFWTGFLERARQRQAPGAARRVTHRSYLDVRSVAGSLAHYGYVIRLDECQVCLYIDCGNAEVNKWVFDELHAARQAIEKAFGGPLEWQRLDHRCASRINLNLPGGGLSDRLHWPEIQDRLIDAMVRLQQALNPQLEQVSKQRRKHGKPRSV